MGARAGTLSQRESARGSEEEDWRSTQAGPPPPRLRGSKTFLARLRARCIWLVVRYSARVVAPLVLPSEPLLQHLHSAMRAAACTPARLRAACASGTVARRTAARVPSRCAPDVHARCHARTARVSRFATRVRATPGTADGPDERLPEDGGIAGFDPMEEVGVPRDQRPANELKALRETFLYSWALLPPSGLLLRAGALFGGVFALLGAPISNGTFDPAAQPAEFVLAATAGSLVVVCAALVRVYLGWAYVGNRLLSAVIEYEETGWYDGQLFVKPPKVLARDRLLGAYEVKPALARLKGLLLSSGLTLVATSVALTALINDGRDADGMYGRGAAVGGPRAVRDGIVFRQAAPSQPAGNEAEEEELGEMALLMYDDAAATAEQKAIRASIGDVPAWCADRYSRAVAGRSVDCDALLARARETRAAAGGEQR